MCDITPFQGYAPFQELVFKVHFPAPHETRFAGLLCLALSAKTPYVLAPPKADAKPKRNSVTLCPRPYHTSPSPVNYTTH
jgi:hypothetical protein